MTDSPPLGAPSPAPSPAAGAYQAAPPAPASGGLEVPACPGPSAWPKVKAAPVLTGAQQAQAAALAEVPLFVDLTDAQRAWVVSLATPGELAPGDYLCRQGEEDVAFFVLLSGRVRVIKQVGDTELVYTEHEAGAFTGELPLLTQMPYGSSVRAIAPATYLRFAPLVFQKLLATFPGFSATVLLAVGERMKSLSLMLSQQEKLSALGTITAGLAHELNNPAAAIRRAADQLLSNEVAARDAVRALCGAGVDAGTMAALSALAAASEPVGAADPLALSDAEEALGDWLMRTGLDAAWDVAPVLAAHGLEGVALAPLLAAMPEPARDPAVRWLAASLQTTELANEIDDSAERISTLVHSVKQYAHMDQAPQPGVDLHRGLDAIIKSFGPELNGITVVREYDPALPLIAGFGKELKQVWTNLIDNAIDAMAGPAGGTLTVRTAHELDRVQIEISDTGAGIPPEIQTRIFEPFFTTKDVGAGTGLGLDIAYRIIVNRHGGGMRVTSRPGATTFTVWLPVAAVPAVTVVSSETAAAVAD